MTQQQLTSGVQVEFYKGHGTENDFIIIDDREAKLAVTAAWIATLCDRQKGLGADGLLRVVKAGALLQAGELQDLPAGVAADDWFMDYRNADGSIAEMCGNGVRVFAHFVARKENLAEQETLRVGTRGGLKKVELIKLGANEAVVKVAMGQPVELVAASSCRFGEFTATGIGISMGNPHLACIVPGLTAQQLAQLPLASKPEFDQAAFPAGVNVEIATPLAQDDTIWMRVHERGVGETRSCGTGTVAAAVAALRTDGKTTGTVKVCVPGGQVTVTVAAENTWLEGPSQLVAQGVYTTP